jgi:hypothetical protein
MRSIPVTANFVSVFVFPANLYAKTRSFFIVITSSIVVTSSIVTLHLPVATDRTVIPIVSVVHSSHMLLLHAPLIHTPHSLAIPLRSPIATDADIIRGLPILLPGLIRLLGGTLWLHRDGLRLIRN